MKNRLFANRRHVLYCLLTAVAISLSSCQKVREGIRKNFQTTDRRYHIKQYSGGKLVATYDFIGTLNDSDGSDGYYFYKGDTLVEISGDVVIKSTK